MDRKPDDQEDVIDHEDEDVQEQVPGGEAADDADEDDAAEEEGALTVQIGDEEPDAEAEDMEKAPQWVRDLRKAKRDADKRIKELEAKVGNEAGAKTELGAKPTLADCDYDTEEFETKLAKWHEDKRAHDAAEAEAEKARDAAEKRWQAKLQAVEEAKANLAVKDFDEAEDMAREVLSQGFNGMGQVGDIRLNIIKQGAKNPALVIYALGKNSKRAKELAAIEDPVEFAMAVGRMEAELKVTRRPSTAPEQDNSRGAGTGAGSVDNTLEKLREKAAKTGDMTEVLAYKRKKKAA